MTRHDENLCDVLHPGKTCIESANDAIDALNRDRARMRTQVATLTVGIEALIEERLNPNRQTGTMPRVRLQEAQTWADSLRALLAPPKSDSEATR